MHGLVQWRARKAGEESSAAMRRWTWLFVAAAVCQTNLEKGRPQFRLHVVTHLLEMGEVNGVHSEDLQVDERGLWWLYTEAGEVYSDDGSMDGGGRAVCASDGDEIEGAWGGASGHANMFT
jgi:hypothetical protein